MIPSRSYKRTEPEHANFHENESVYFGVEENASDRSHIPDELGILGMRRGGWKTYNPARSDDNILQPRDEQGNIALFEAYPSYINNLYSTDDLTPKAVQHLLALAHQDAKKYGSGKVSYGNSLSEHSSPMVLHALDSGYLEENPTHTRGALQKEADFRSKTRAKYLESDDENKADADDRKYRRRLGSSRLARSDYNDVFKDRGVTVDWYEDDAGNEYSYDSEPMWKQPEDLPDTAGQDAVNAVKAERARRVAQQELPEPAQEPVTHEGNLWDHAGKKDKKSWDAAASSVPAASRVGSFKDSLVNAVSKIRGR